MWNLSLMKEAVGSSYASDCWLIVIDVSENIKSEMRNEGREYCRRFTEIYKDLFCKEINDSAVLCFICSVQQVLSFV